MEKDLSKILPHDKPMILIDDILEIDMKNQFVKTSVKIHENKIFFVTNMYILGIGPESLPTTAKSWLHILM